MQRKTNYSIRLTDGQTASTTRESQKPPGKKRIVLRMETEKQMHVIMMCSSLQSCVVHPVRNLEKFGSKKVELI